MVEVEGCQNPCPSGRQTDKVRGKLLRFAYNSAKIYVYA